MALKSVNFTLRAVLLSFRIVENFLFDLSDKEGVCIIKYYD